MKKRRRQHGGSQADLFAQWLRENTACYMGRRFCAGRTVLECWRDENAEPGHLYWLMRRLFQADLLLPETWTRVTNIYMTYPYDKTLATHVREVAPEPQLLFRRLKDGTVSATWRTGR